MGEKAKSLKVFVSTLPKGILNHHAGNGGSDVAPHCATVGENQEEDSPVSGF